MVDWDKTHPAWQEPGAHAGEDVWILSQFPEDYAGTAVELGALDGHYVSNTLLLEQKGWTVLCIEPNPLFHEALKKNRKLVLTCACGIERRDKATLYVSTTGVYGNTLSGLSPLTESGYGMVPLAETEVRTLDECLEISGFTKLDVLSLDVDGDELPILQGANMERWQPRVVCVETVLDIGEQDVSRRCADVRAFLVNLGYQARARLGHNTLYVRA